MQDLKPLTEKAVSLLCAVTSFHPSQEVTVMQGLREIRLFYSTFSGTYYICLVFWHVIVFTMSA